MLFPDGAHTFVLGLFSLLLEAATSYHTQIQKFLLREFCMLSHTKHFIMKEHAILLIAFVSY